MALAVAHPPAAFYPFCHCDEASHLSATALRCFYHHQKKTSRCSWLRAGSLHLAGTKPVELRAGWMRKPRSRPIAASLGGLFGGIFKSTDSGESTRQLYASTLALINALDSQMSSLSDSQLRDMTATLQQRARSGESLDSLLPVRVSSFIFFFSLTIYVCLPNIHLIWFFEKGTN